MDTTSLTDRILAHAHALGFERAGVVRAAPLPHAEAYHDWLREGRHGEMGYMDRHHELRQHPGVLEPGTRSVVVVAKNYFHPSDMLDGGMRLARYAHGDDYHDTLRARLKELAAFIHAETGADVGARPAVDSAPLLERDAAVLAGLGWVGKNTLLIHPQHGSFYFLAELLVNLDLEETTTRVPDRCGRCSRCIDVCPTGAIVSPYILDARRCISYLTIELRGPIPRALRPLIGDYLFGCDLCQDVCPWNGRATPTADPALQTRAIYTTLGPEDLLKMDQSAFSTTFARSPIKRTKRRGLLRNAAVVLGNRRDPALLDLLAARLTEEPEPLVRGHLAWAIGALDTDAARDALISARDAEAEPYVLEEIRAALGWPDDKEQT